MKTLISAALAASVLSLGAPVLAQTQTLSSDPVAIENVNYTAGTTDTKPPSDIQVAFENTAASPAREVTFEVDDATGQSVDVRDVGTFAPNVTIRHDYQVSNSLKFGLTAHVVHVQLADGSTWDEPTPQERRQAAAF